MMSTRFVRVTDQTMRSQVSKPQHAAMIASDLPVSSQVESPDLRVAVMTERSNYQKNIIRNYYENRETIALQRAQEIITELYLSEGKKRQRHWKSLATHLLKLGTKQETIDHLIKQDDPQKAARIVERLANKN